MKWFDQWFLKKSRWAWDHGQEIVGSNSIGIGTDDANLWSNGLRINLSKVIGGYVVGFRTYNAKIDRTDERTYIITSDQDFNLELGKIITIESMRQL